jgi:Tol biopolymer transport system component
MTRAGWPMLAWGVGARVRSMRMLGRLAMGVAVVAGAALPAQAQYFGRNPVQWERLEFQVLKTDHFDIHYYPEEKAAAEQVGRMAERWYARLSRILRYEFKDRQPIILYASHGHFQQTNTIGGPPGESTGGVTEAYKRRVVLPVAASLAETDHVLGHELVHAFQYAMTGRGRSAITSAALDMPLWFIEGMAEYLSLGPVDPQTAMWMRDAALREKLPTIRQLGSARYFPYRYGQAVWSYLAARFGDDVMRQMLTYKKSTYVETMLKAVLGVDEKTLSSEWHAALKEGATSQTSGRQSASTYGTALVTQERGGGRLNVGPALSPDGDRLAFLSERDLFSVELFVADAQNGTVTRRLSRTLVDPHLESLQFVNSAGAWDRAGQRLALGAVSKGRPLLVILDARTGASVHEVPFPTLGEIQTPSFAPDGNRIVFSALAGGSTDLFIYDVEAGTSRRLTEDAYADLQPAWSPDGRTIAFVTDRFSTRLDTLAAGNYRLAAVDVESGAIRPLRSFAEAKNINPQWAPSGRSLYFLSDASGATNIYRLDTEGDALYQLTDLVTGVSGITALSPALSAAVGSDRLAFSTYDKERYEIYSMSDAQRLQGWPVEGKETAQAGLIPGARAAGEVMAARADARTGLADTGLFHVRPYKPGLGLDFIGQPSFNAGVNGYGSYFSGGATASFSDMLGEHNLGVLAHVDRVSGFSNLGGVVSYVNRVHRFNWGLQVAQAPRVVRGMNSDIVTSGDDRVYVRQTLTQRELDRSVAALGYYPFGPSLRLEGRVRMRGIGFDTRMRTQRVQISSAQLILDQEESVPPPDGIHLFEGSLGLVRDTSVFGATSPIMGQRFRLEVEPVVGTMSYTGALADFRQYFMPRRPVTVAARLVHYGRYGSGSDDRRLVPLFLGSPSLVRGYDNRSFTAAECSASGCPIYDQLLGSRLLAASLEVRAPLLALFGNRKLYGTLPVDVGAFFDAGVAWDAQTRPALFGGGRSLVKSLGVTARLNMFGFAILQLDFVKALDRPGKRPYLTINLLSGF